MSKRVLLAGLYHETHTFLTGLTRMSDCTVLRGEELLSCVGDASPMGGVVEAANAFGWEITPVLDIRATPGPTVEDAVVDRFLLALETALAAHQDRLDGVCLVLHGAMVSESLDDVEGEVLARVRRLLGGREIPVCGVIDLHANFTARMAAYSDALIAYRENPHTDAKESAGRAAELLDRLMGSGMRAHTIWEPTRIMWPPTGTGTADEPMRSLEEAAREIERSCPGIPAVNVLSGFSYADTPDTGLSFSAVVIGDEDAARAHLRRLNDLAVSMRKLGNVIDPPLDEIMPLVRAHSKGPVIVAEPSDNIGAGAPGDCTGLLRAFIEYGIPNAAITINDPEAVALLAAHGPGARVTTSLGGKTGSLAGGPMLLDLEIISTSDGRFELEDSHSHLASMVGTSIDMGPCAVVRHRGVTVLVTSKRTPPFDLGQWRSQGIEPGSLFATGVKSAVAYRRAYDPIAVAHYRVDTPGPCSSNLRSFDFRKIRRPVYPLDEI